MSQFKSAHQTVCELADDFEKNEAKYVSSNYQESEARKDFIDKFFIALGWDVNHEEQKNPYAQEVKVERSVPSSPARRKADYAFSLAPDYETVRFYVEAKRPSHNLENPDHYFQTIRYGWNAGTPVSVLTNFEEFHIVDCRFVPDIETALRRQVETFHYTDYRDEEAFSRIYYLFSREAVEDGYLSDYADRHLPEPEGKAVQKGLFKGGFQKIDETFLEDLSTMRLQMARAFMEENPDLSDAELTEATQRTLDRLVFMRFLEDRLIEPDPIVSELGTTGSMWEDFKSASRRLDAKYNGIVFRQHFTDEEEFGGVASAHFRSVVEEFSPDNSPYDFSALPIHILGAIYERFLGRTVTASEGKVEIEEKPLVQEAGGVYYTPQPIVNRIVDQTVGKLIESSSPEEVLELNFADIACGSGSFLITTFDRLLEHFTEWYQEHPEQAEEDGCFNVGGQWVLSLHQKREILTSCIYGVDVDFQATEVAQLSLYLKLLEDETQATANQTQVLFKEKILPDLSNNIVGGNSLISFDAVQGDFFTNGEGAIERVNPMNFEVAFPDILDSGGFDAIVGNPPYVRHQTMMEVDPEAVDVYNDRYKVSGKGNYDIYTLFVEKGLDLLSEEGILGYILPNKFFNAKYGRPLRQLISEENHLRGIVNFTDQQVFDEVTTYTCLLFLTARPNKEFEYMEIDELEKWLDEGEAKHTTIETREVSADDWNFIAGPARPVFKKLENIDQTVGDVAERISQGIRTSSNKVYVLDLVSSHGEDVITARSDSLNREVTLEREATNLFLRGEDIRPFQVLYPGKVVVVPYKINENRVELIPEQKMEERFPKTWNYLLDNKEALEEREDGAFRGEGWHRYGRSQNIDLMLKSKILVPDIADHARFAMDDNGSYAFTSGYGITLKEETVFTKRSIIALLNSNVLDFYIQKVSTDLRGGFFRYFKQFIEQLPLPELDKNLNLDVVRRLEKLSFEVENGMEDMEEARTDRKKKIYNRKIKGKKKEINNISYRIYDLSKNEQNIIEDEIS